MDTQLLLDWLYAMKASSSQYPNDMYSVGARKAYQTIIDLINAGAFVKNEKDANKVVNP
ncbi:Hypothetical protein LUCI_4465 [Lucifera butyrica]|uniref:Uncharacterized protein n=1 Tax=Lucifera butyrica TaxID=1351585 RepID=A0A498RD06_9FIRM|nr:hypothetical protein [Lucifera butyrica]VBB09179.1 Hypothetical protein LUCI_4465 [Lucifera butyrica]